MQTFAMTAERLPELSLIGCLCAGAVAGTSVDVTLHPIDTIKTRIQSQYGFRKAGGFKKIYSGIGSVLVGSAPGAALFFASYESSKRVLSHQMPQLPSAANHLLAGSIGEIFACTIRVPTEVIKQRSQSAFGKAGVKRSSISIAREVLRSEGLRGFYRGYRITVTREIPFAMIQYPIWEFLKEFVSNYQGVQVNAIQAAGCGSAAGVVSAAITTPLDLAKTRIMLAERTHGHSKGRITRVLYDIYEVDGLAGLFKGGATRSFWIGLGGFVFFGAFEFTRILWLRQAYGAENVHVQHLGVYDGFIDKLDFLYHSFFDIGDHKEIRKVTTFEDRIRLSEELVKSGTVIKYGKKDVGLGD